MAEDGWMVVLGLAVVLLGALVLLGVPVPDTSALDQYRALGL